MGDGNGLGDAEGEGDGDGSSDDETGATAGEESAGLLRGAAPDARIARAHGERKMNTISVLKTE